MTVLLSSDRLIIRDWILDSDVEQVFTIYNDPEVTYFLGKNALVTSIESQRQRLREGIEKYKKLNNGSGFWAIVEKESSIILGTILLKQLPDNKGLLTKNYEVGWHLRRSAWGQGYATEAGKALLKYGFTVLQLPVIYAVVKSENHASIRVIQRLSMQPLGTTNNYYGLELLLFEKKPF